MKSIRCSALPMLFACAPSQAPGDLLIESANGASDLGSAAHEALALISDGLEPDLVALARRYNVDPDELGPLIWYGRQALKQLEPSFPNARSEVAVAMRLEALELTGHIDLLSDLDGIEARGVDWKSGRKEEADYYAQVAGYAACLILGLGFERAVFSVVWLRSGMIETLTFTRDDVLAFAARVSARLAEVRYRTGEHCGHCARSHNCPALIAASRRDLAIFGSNDAGDLVAQAPPEKVVELKRRIRALSSFAESLDQAIRRRVAADGPLDSGDGYALSLVEENGKRAIDTIKAFPVLQERLDDAELASCITVSARAADEAVATKAGRGRGAAAKRELAAALEAVGAVTQTVVVKLKEVRQPMQHLKESA